MAHPDRKLQPVMVSLVLALVLYSLASGSAETRALVRRGKLRANDVMAAGIGNFFGALTPKALNNLDKEQIQISPLAATGTLSLVQMTRTGLWSPPSPDPGGITFWPGTGHLLMSDSEVDEMSNLFVGKNLFEMALDGRLLNTYSTMSFTKEPTGVAINPADGHFYVSQDGGNRIFDIAPGADGKPWTADDHVRQFSLTGFGVLDTEDLAFGDGKLFIADGKNTEVWVISPGANGRFDGPPTSGDDTATHFDVSRYGLRDVEGIAYHPDTGRLWVCSRRAAVLELTTAGALVDSYDISFVGSIEPDGITIAPGSNNSTEMHIYVADRMVDNNVDPKENDGRVYEFSAGGSSPPPSGNLLANPGFELDANNDNRPDSWSTSSKFTRSNVQVQSGNFAGRFLDQSDSSFSIIQKVSGLAPGTMYNFSGWANIPSTNDTFTFAFQVRWINSSGATISTKTVKSYTGATGGWNQASAALISPSGTASAIIRMKVTSLNAVIYVDDLSFGR